MPFLALALSLSLSACGERKPEGQTAAVVNGQPITETEVDVEMASSQDKTITRERALSTLIDRALLLEEAREQKLDQRPQYTLQLKRMGDILLAQSYVETLSGGSGNAVSDVEVNSFLAAHPEIGPNRRQITLKQVIYKDQPQLRGDLEAAKTYDDFVAVLRANDVEYEEGSTSFDTAIASEGMLKALSSAEPGEPFVLVSDGQALASALDKEVPVTTTLEEQIQIARGRMKQQSVGSLLDRLMQSRKKEAKIEYAPKYKPGAAKDGKQAAPAS